MSQAIYRELRGSAAFRGIDAGAAFLPVAVALLLAATGWYVASAPLHHDCALFLYFTDRYLGGGQLYVDILELNPPLAFWLTVPPVWLARTLALAPEPVFIGYIAALVGAVLLLLHRLSEGLPGLSPVSRRLLVLAAAVLLGPGAVHAFGQREHLLVLFVLPYLFVVALRAARRPVRWPVAVMVGLLAATGLLLKPYFLILPIALELYLLAVRRHWSALLRPESGSLAVSGVLYVIAVQAFTPAFLDAVVPMLVATYESYNAPLAKVLGKPELALFLPIALILLLLRPRGVLGRPLPVVLLIAGGCCLAAYVVQQKGWFYQFYPTPVLLGLWFATAAFLGDAQGGRRTWQLGRVVALVGAVAVVATPIVRGPYANGFITEVKQALADHGGGARSMFVFSAQVSMGFPTVLSERMAWASRFPHLWPLPATLVERDGIAPDRAAALDRAQAYVVDAVVADMAVGRPDIVFIDRREEKNYFAGPFDYLDFFLADPRFAALWETYRPVGRSAHFDIYRRGG